MRLRIAKTATKFKVFLAIKLYIQFSKRCSYHLLVSFETRVIIFLWVFSHKVTQSLEMSQRAVFQALIQFNNKCAFFGEISTKNLMFSKNLKFEYLFPLYTYNDIRWVCVIILSALCFSHLKSENTFRLRLLYILVHGSV